MEPHFRHCCTVWGCAGLTEINQLQSPQIRADRMITNSSFDAPSRPLNEGLGWKTVEELVYGLQVPELGCLLFIVSDLERQWRHTLKSVEI